MTMGRALIWMDAVVRRSERLGWAVLVCAALAWPWFGLEAPLPGPIGEGWVPLDAMVTGLLWAAAAAQVARIVQAPAGEHVLVRTAAWLLLLTLTLLSARMAWILATAGDIHMTPTMGGALASLALSVLLHAIGRVIYGSA